MVIALRQIAQIASLVTGRRLFPNYQKPCSFLMVQVLALFVLLATVRIIGIVS
jgi:hypothetical protein